MFLSVMHTAAALRLLTHDYKGNPSASGFNHVRTQIQTPIFLSEVDHPSFNTTSFQTIQTKTIQ